MYPTSDQRLTYETAEVVYFFSGPFDTLNNFSAHAVNIWGRLFPTVEHAFQWKKFESTERDLASSIAGAISPTVAKKLGQSKAKRRPDWPDAKIGFMTEIIRAKVSQHKDVKKLLLATGEKEIVENSPTDKFWGAGSDGKGLNQMGKILMLVRDEVRDEVSGAM